MRTKIILTGIFFLAAYCSSLLLSGCARLPQTSSLPEEKWREDLRYLATELPRLHKNAFFQVTQKEFEQAVQELDEAIPSLQEHEIIVGFMQIVAMLGDAHTGLSISHKATGFRTYPLRLYWFSDGLYVTDTVPAYRRALGARLIQIGETDVEKAYTAVRNVIPHENEAWVKYLSPKYLVTPEILHALGIIPDLRAGRFTFEDGNGTLFSLEMRSVPPGNQVDLLPAVDPAKLPLSNIKKGVNYWYAYIEDKQTLYFQYNKCSNRDEKPFTEFSKEMLSFLDQYPVEKFIIDIRYNGGGDSSLLRPLITEIKNRPGINQKGRLFVLVGRNTFSSAIINAIELRNQTSAIFVGEPTGGNPNHFGHPEVLRLPNSALELSYSTKYFNLSNDESSLIPDITVPLSSADYFAGRDPVLEKILSSLMVTEG